MADNTKLQYIVELLTQGDTKRATDELNKLNKAGKDTSTAMDKTLASSKQLFAFLGGTALIKESLDKFLDAERGLNALNAALVQTGNDAPGALDAIKALADALGDDLKVQADDVIKVMTQLLSFGANPKDLKRLTELVYDLSEVMGRDVTRASRQMAQALKGDFTLFAQFGIEVDKSKSATENLNSAVNTLVELFNGRAKSAVKGVAGDVQGLTVTFDDAKQKLGEWTAAVLTTVANSAAAFGKMTASSTVTEAGRLMEGVHDKARAAIEKEIAAMEKLGTVTAREAEKIRTSLALAFGEDVFDLKDGALDPKGNRKRDMSAEERALGEAGARIGAKGFGGSKPSVPAATEIRTPGLDLNDELAALEERNKIDDEAVRIINEQYEARQRVADIEDRQSLEALENYRNAEAMKKDLHDQIVLTILDGEARVQAEMRINHERRVQMIQDTKFETEESYMEAMTHEEALFLAEQQRYNQAQTYSAKLKVDMIGVAESGAQAFSSGLAGAIVSAFEEGDKAFQKFAANFLRQIAEMILQALILRAIKGAFGMKDGGQATAMAAGGMIYAASGIAGVNSLTSPTYFPKFNVLAGEAGREVMTVLARPSFERINGVPAQIGYAGGNRLAITSADALAGAGGGGAGGNITIEVRVSQGSEARIIENSVKQARVAVVQDMSTDSQLSRVTRQKVS